MNYKIIIIAKESQFKYFKEQITRLRRNNIKIKPMNIR